MNLYEARFKHYAPKGSQEGIKEYFLAANDDMAYLYIDKSHCCSRWEEIIEEIKADEDYDLAEQQKLIDEFRKEIFENKGEIDFEPKLYYPLEKGNGYDGYTRYGWRLVEENISEFEIAVLKGLKIIE